jgi:hypothetical protein
MTLCPIAIVASCKQCPVFKVCPVKGMIGDYVKPDETPKTTKPKPKAKAKK